MPTFWSWPLFIKIHALHWKCCPVWVFWHQTRSVGIYDQFHVKVIALKCVVQFVHLYWEFIDHIDIDHIDHIATSNSVMVEEDLCACMNSYLQHMLTLCRTTDLKQTGQKAFQHAKRSLVRCHAYRLWEVNSYNYQQCQLHYVFSHWTTEAHLLNSFVT